MVIGATKEPDVSVIVATYNRSEILRGTLESLINQETAGLQYEVIVVDNLSSGRRQNLSTARSSPRFTFVEHDVTEPLTIEGKLDWILHFASPASPPKYLSIPVETLRANGEGAYRLLEIAHCFV